MILEATTSVEREINPWLAAEARFDEAARKLGLDDGIQKVLRMPAIEMTVKRKEFQPSSAGHRISSWLS